MNSFSLLTAFMNMFGIGMINAEFECWPCWFVSFPACMHAEYPRGDGLCAAYILRPKHDYSRQIS